MVRVRLWFRCAAMGDPVRPVIIQPAIIGWEAKYRKVELQIERTFDGEELLRRMKGWITIDPSKVIEKIKPFGRLKVLDDRELVIEMESIEDLKNLENVLKDSFGDEVEIEILKK